MGFQLANLRRRTHTVTDEAHKQATFRPVYNYVILVHVRMKMLDSS